MRLVELLDPLHQIRGHRADVALDQVPGLVALDDELLEVLVEQVADHADQEIGLLVQRLGVRRPALLGLGDGLVDGLPLRLETRDVGTEFLGTDPFRGGADDDAGLVGDELCQDLLEPLALDIGQLTADARRRPAGHVHQVAAGQRDLRGQAGTLVPDRVLADLDEDVVPRLECLFDLARTAVESGGVPVDLARVQHAVAAAADVDERRFHARQDVLDPTEVDVADHRRRRRGGHEVFDEDAVLEDRDLGVVLDRGVFVPVVAGDAAVGAALPDDHDTVDRFAARQELRLGQDRWPATTGIAAVATTLALGLQAGRARDALYLVAGPLAARLPLVHHRVRRIVGGRLVGLAPALAAAATATAAGRRRIAVLIVAGRVVTVIVAAVGVVAGLIGTVARRARGLGVGRLVRTRPAAAAPRALPRRAALVRARLVLGRAVLGVRLTCGAVGITVVARRVGAGGVVGVRLVGVGVGVTVAALVSSTASASTTSTTASTTPTRARVVGARLVSRVVVVRIIGIVGVDFRLVGRRAVALRVVGRGAGGLGVGGLRVVSRRGVDGRVRAIRTGGGAHVGGGLRLGLGGRVGLRLRAPRSGGARLFGRRLGLQEQRLHARRRVGLIGRRRHRRVVVRRRRGEQRRGLRPRSGGGVVCRGLGRRRGRLVPGRLVPCRLGRGRLRIS